MAHICILALHSRFIGCLPLEKSVINSLIINNYWFVFNGKIHFTIYSGIIVTIHEELFIIK
jgi:hypothetical protein